MEEGRACAKPCEVMSEGHSERDVAGEGKVFKTQQKQPREAIE